MSVPFLFAGRNTTTLHRLHQAARRNILRNHRNQTRRHESTKQQTGRDEHASSSSSSSSSSSQPPPPATTPSQPPAPPISLRYRFPPQAWAWIDPLLLPFRAYGRMQKRSPLITQLESTLVIYYIGDLSAQSVQTSAFTTAPYEPIRGFRAMLIGSISSIPSYKFFIFLGRHFNYSSHLVSLAVKIVVSQCVFTPIFNSYFFGMQTLLAGGSFREARDRVVNTVPVSWANSWKVWPAVTAFSFTFVPWQYRNVFAGVIAIGWQTYLSWLNRAEEVREGLVGGNSKKKMVQEGKMGSRRADEEEKLVEEKPVAKKRKKKAKKVDEEEEGQT